MKRFALLLLFNQGWHSGNKVLAETKAKNHKEASDYFANLIPGYNLKEGYAKSDYDVSYCVAEFYEPFSSYPKINK